MNNSSLDSPSLSSLHYSQELKKWLKYKQIPISKKYEEEEVHHQHYKELVRSLRKDRNPHGTATLILGFKPQSVIESKELGRVTKEFLKKEISKDPRKHHLSPAVILSEKRRKDILESMKKHEHKEIEEKYINAEEPLPASSLSEADKNLTLKSTLSSMEANFSNKQINGSPGKDPENNQLFRPKWEHYDTMKARWRYLLPQTKHLLDSESMILPAKETSYIPVQGNVLNGNYVEIDNFVSKYQHSVIERQTLSRQSWSRSSSRK